MTAHRHNHDRTDDSDQPDDHQGEAHPHGQIGRNPSDPVPSDDPENEQADAHAPIVAQKDPEVPMREREEKGFTMSDRVIGGIVAAILGALHLVPHPDITALGNQIREMTTELRLAGEKITTVGNQIAVIQTNAEHTASELADHEARLRILQTQEDKMIPNRFSAGK